MIKNIRNAFKKIQYHDVEKRVWEVSDIAYGLADWIIVAGVSIMISSFLGLIVFKIMAVGGLSAILADLMASTCINSAIPCEFDTLLGGVGLSLVVITTFFFASVRLIARENDMFEIEYKNYQSDPHRNYNDTQTEFLRIIKALGGTTNLRKLATFMEMPYTTARNYIDVFERDGYVKIHSNGQGTQIEIEVLKQ